jgi:histidyl-tRNA synthetase
MTNHSLLIQFYVKILLLIKTGRKLTMKELIPSVKGTRDFYPEIMQMRSWLYANMRAVSERFGYQEYDGPFLEFLDLYAAKSGDELVKEQSFVFQDRSGEWLTLRPELTPSLARMIAQKQKQLTYPLRWWSFGPMWRYERPQKGRTREFFQWNIDLIGQDLPAADAELAAIGASFFQEVGLSSDQIQLNVNNRRLLEKQLDTIGIPRENRANYLRLIDRIDKMSQTAWENYAQEEFLLNPQQIDGILKMLGDTNAWQDFPELIEFFEAVQTSGAGDYIRYAPEIVRGLDYYTGTVFEARDRDGEFRAILGGGRYDNLVADVGGEPLPGVGFAMGDVVIGLVLKKYELLQAAEAMTVRPVFVTVFDQNSLSTSLSIASDLRKGGIPTVCANEPAKLGKQFKLADRLYAPLVIVCGPEEFATNSATVKFLKTGEQITVARSDLEQTVRKLLDLDPAS